MIKFLAKKELLFLVPFQSASPADPDYVWPEAYNGDIEHLIGLLRQAPPYQIDNNHHHCGLRVRILPALDFIRDCFDTGIGINPMRWKTDRASQTWISEKPSKGRGGKAFTVGGEVVGEDAFQPFDFTTSKTGMEFGPNSLDTAKVAKTLFTANSWTWTSSKEEESSRLLKTSLKW